MIVVTGGAGFIGSNIVAGLNRRGVEDILVVDDLGDGTKFRNIVDCRIADYMDRSEFLPRLEAGDLPPLRAVFHEGACSATTEWDGRYMMDNNYRFSKVILHHCLRERVPLLYASSGAVYGLGNRFVEEPACEDPANVYGYSKALFDQYVRRLLPRAESQVVGFRYFNVYGPREAHKGQMASVALHHFHQIREQGRVRLFEGCDGYAAGEQRRDFVHIDDVVDVNLWFLDRPEISGVFNVGTGRAASFNEVARAVIDHFGEGEIEYIPFPEALRGRYQSFTEADIGALRRAGYERRLLNVQAGVAKYMQSLDPQPWRGGNMLAESL